MLKITFLGNAGMLWIIITAIFLISKKYRTTGAVMLTALIADLIICDIFLKPMIARTRPYDINTPVTLLISKQGDYSFPSGHTAAAFASVIAMYLCGCKYWKIAGIIAVIIAFSRLYLYVHYPTDILGGIVVGIICAFIGARVCRMFKLNRKT